MPIGIPSSSVTTNTYNTAGSYTWSKPSGISTVTILCIGSGGNGGTVTTTNGGGGGGGGISVITVPAFLVPDTLYLKVGAGGAGNTSANYTFASVFNNGWVAQDIFIYAVGGTNATTSTGGTGGTNISNTNLIWYNPVNAMNFGVLINTSAGPPGGTGSNYIDRLPLVTGGTGGGSAGGAGGVIHAYGSIPEISGGAFGVNGINGTTTVVSGMFMFSGGTGGGAGNTTTLPGNGGKGGPGCGGGGPGYTSGATVGTPGSGGDGYIGITWA